MVPQYFAIDMGANCCPFNASSDKRNKFAVPDTNLVFSENFRLK